MSLCRDCSFPIKFVRMRTGRALPIDAHPDDLGNVVASRDVAGHLVDGHVVAPGVAVSGGELRFMPHHATCPVRVGQRPTPKPKRATTDTARTLF